MILTQPLFHYQGDIFRHAHTGRCFFLRDIHSAVIAQVSLFAQLIENNHPFVYKAYCLGKALNHRGMMSRLAR